MLGLGLVGDDAGGGLFDLGRIGQQGIVEFGLRFGGLGRVGKQATQRIAQDWDERRQ